MTRTGKLLHGVLWLTLVFLLMVYASVWRRPHVIGESFGNSWLYVTSIRPFERFIPLAYAKYLAALPSVKSMTWATVDGNRVPGRGFEVITTTQIGFGTVDAQGRLQARSLGPKWIVIDPQSLLRWQADPHGLLPTRNVAARKGWKLGDTVQFPISTCGQPMRGTIAGFVTGNIGDRMLAHYEHLNDMKVGCPNHDEVVAFELEVARADQERVAAEIDQHFKDEKQPTITYPSDDFYWKFFAPWAAGALGAVARLLLSLTFCVAMALLLLGQRERCPPRVVWGAHAIAVLVTVGLFLVFRVDGIHVAFGWWGMENIILFPEALGASLGITTLLAAAWGPLQRLTAAFARGVGRFPGERVAFTVGLASAVIITYHYGDIEGVDRVIDAHPMRDVTVVFPEGLDTFDQLDPLRAMAKRLDGSCVAIHVYSEHFRWRNANGDRIRVMADGHRPAPPRCGLIEPEPSPASARLLDAYGSTGLKTFPVAGRLGPVEEVKPDPAAPIRHTNLIMSLDDFLDSVEFGDYLFHPMLFARSVPAEFSEAPSVPWRQYVHESFWDENDAIRGAAFTAALWIIAAAILRCGRSEKRARRILMLLLGIATGTLGIELAGRLGLGGVGDNDFYLVPYKLAVGPIGLRPLLALTAGLVLLELIRRPRRPEASNPDGSHTPVGEATPAL